MLNSKRLTTMLLAVGLLGTSSMLAYAQDVTAPAAATETVAPDQDNRMWQKFKAKFGGGKDARPGRNGALHEAIFTEVDGDKSGSVTLDEINAYRAAKVVSADTSKDGALSLEEFSAAYNAMMKDRTVRAFQRLDADADGSITSVELDTSIATMFARMDRNDDGTISKDDRQHRSGKHNKSRHGNGGSHKRQNN